MVAEDDSIIDRGVGEADHLQRLWTPYRMSYLAEGPLKQDRSDR
ncbi:MAG TPA: diadenosine tetraphosphate hydrolase, partial [Mycobacterium sp.]|nr:diadenosine tetraphosphate hydrolase [Mycobacterium sp.]